MASRFFYTLILNDLSDTRQAYTNAVDSGCYQMARVFALDAVDIVIKAKRSLDDINSANNSAHLFVNEYVMTNSTIGTEFSKIKEAYPDWSLECHFIYRVSDKYIVLVEVDEHNVFRATRYTNINTRRDEQMIASSTHLEKLLDHCNTVLQNQ